jgi:L-asparaginase/Glu-tRNA(Gln) amidotransferase subunit D
LTGLARGAAVLIMLCLESATSDPARVSTQELPHVRVIATGETIVGQADAEQLTGAALLVAVSELAIVARIEVEEFSRIGSSGMTPEHWLRLATRVNEFFSQDADLSGVALVLLLLSATACVLPARRATGVNPGEVSRAEQRSELLRTAA